MGEVQSINTREKTIQTTFGTVHYDDLVLAAGATTNFFGNKNLEQNTYPMKTVSESMQLRNTIFSRLEEAVCQPDEAEREALMTIAVVGGGPSGVEIAGVLAEMKRTVIHRDYPDLSARMHIYLINAGDRLLAAIDPKLSAEAEKDLKEMGVHIRQNSMVTDYVDGRLVLKNGTRIPSKTVIWVSGIVANSIKGIPAESIGRGGRILTDRYCRVKGMEHVYAIGDQSLVEGDPKYPYGHPQLAQVAMQQADIVAKNLKGMDHDQAPQPFIYRNLGTMATIGRKKAVAEIGKLRFGGLFAWLLWLVVHLRSILGVKNKTIVFLNWMWNYMNYKQSLRLILRPAGKPTEEK